MRSRHRNMAGVKSMVLVMAAGLAVPTVGRAALRVWDGSESSDWTNGLNWVGGTAPNGSTSGDGVQFVEATATKTVTVPNATVGVNSLQFNNSAGWTINGAGSASVLSIGWSNISSSGAGTNTINTGIKATDNLTFNPAAGNTLVISGNFDIANFAPKMLGAGTLRFQGNLMNHYSTDKVFTTQSGTTELGAPSGANLRYVRASGGTIKLIAANQFSTGAASHYVCVDGTGSLNLNSYSTSMRTLAVGAAAATGIGGVGGGTVDVTTATLTASSLLMKGGAITGTTGSLALSGGVTADAYTTSSTIGVTMALSGTAGTFNVGDGAAAVDLDITGAINGGVSLTKSGNGVLRLSGTSGYTGATNVNAGTLLVSGSGSVNSSTGITVNGGTFQYTSSTALTKPVTFGASGGKFIYDSAAAYAGSLTVGANTTLGGSGVLGAVTSTGGTIAPGNSPGTLTVASLALDANSTLNYDLSESDHTIGSLINDYIVVNGNLTLDGTLNLVAPAELTAGNYTLFHYTGSLINNGLAIGANFGTANNQSYSIVIDPDAKNVNLLVTIPEPAAVMLLAGSAMLSLRRRRRA